MGILALRAQLYKNVLSKKYDQTTQDSYTLLLYLSIQASTSRLLTLYVQILIIAGTKQCATRFFLYGEWPKVLTIIFNYSAVHVSLTGLKGTDFMD